MKTFNTKRIRRNLSTDRTEFADDDATRFDSPIMADIKKRARLTYLPLDDIEPDPKQPRKDFGEEELNDLAESIQEHDVLQPIIVFQVVVDDFAEQTPKPYRILSGERRYRASTRAKKETIPALVLPEEPPERLKRVIQFHENDKRQGLNPIENALFYQSMLVDGTSHRQVAKDLGIKDHTKISRGLKLLELPEYIQTALGEGIINESGGRLLAGIADANEQRRKFDAMVRREATAADLKKEKKTGGAKSNGRTRNGTFDGVKLTAKIEKRHTNSDIVVAALLWSERFLEDSRTSFDRTQIRELVSRLNQMVNERSEQLQSKAA